MAMRILYIVGTPIGNLEDITLRALRILREVDVIFCEDTRVTAKLLKNYKISKPLKQFHAHTRVRSSEFLVPYRAAAYVSDAGMPGVSDPGAQLVNLAREAGARVEVVPGPSALTSLIAIAGEELSQFIFFGFLPHKKGRQTALREIAGSSRPALLYESSHRILRLLQELPEGAQVIIGRELTKKFEEVLRGTPAELLALMSADPNKQKGEFVVLVTKG